MAFDQADGIQFVKTEFRCPALAAPHIPLTCPLQAKGQLVSAIMKKNLMENVVPVLVELKHLLAACKSPLTGMLMAALRAMLKDFKAEVEDILAVDKQLAKELLYDMQQAEQEVRARAICSVIDGTLSLQF
eukprot:9039311-Pyramimonas_sp.AAC.3